MLIPQPTSHEPRPGRFPLTADTGVHAPDAPEVADLLRALLTPATGLALAATEPGPGVISLLLADGDLGPEGYTLEVTGDRVVATAGTAAGLRWAVQTLRQLLPPSVYSPTPVEADWSVPCGRTTDRPAHAWRGGMLDVGRWHHPVSFLYEFADLLAAHKLNRFHLHLTEDQGWRFDVRRYPRLTSVGAYRSSSPIGHTLDNLSDHTPHGGYYTQDELRGLVAYAARLGVTVVPEIDLPGHTQAAIAAYPELGNRPDVQHEVMNRFGISEHVLNVERSTVEFMCGVLDELIDVFPSEYIHLGGDEVPPREWSENPGARALMAELGIGTPEGLLGWWIRQLADHLATRGRKVIVWDELVGAGAPADAVVMAWRGPERVDEALAAGHPVIATPQSHLYLDHAESLAPGEPLSITGPLPLDKVYGYRPGDGVLGVQGNLWTEYLPNAARAEYNLLPRLAAVAEVAWGTAGDVAGFRERLATQVLRYEAEGVNYRALD
ncbi:beta-N-acetylhexosaminidase [Longispora sp. NPDC051575]|uniref:beta-N-acetylhexosaminidase n=1 Tax=Longispora sp. NPDC051575 TaxID=3154943 RepID=UPI0034171E44